MSHFTVAVISYNIGDVDELLGSFCEDADHPSVETEFVDMEDEYRNAYETEYTERIKTADGEYLSPWDDKICGKWTGAPSEKELPEGYQQLNVPFKELYASFEQYMEEYVEMGKDEDTGRYGYYTNPDAKWDWYQIGGRWQGILKLKPGKTGNNGEKSFMDHTPYKEGFCDQALIADVDFSMDMDTYRKALRFWEVYVDGQPPQDGEGDLTTGFHWTPEYYASQYENKERYAEEQSSFHTWAVLTPDGEWYEAGEMGWFGMHSATRETKEEYRSDIKMLLEDWKDCYITIVDCHI